MGLTAEEFAQLQENKADEATQKLRLKAMDGKTMLLVSGSFLYPSMAKSIRDSVKEIINMGCSVYMVFQADKKNDKYYQDAKDDNCFHQALFCDLTTDQAGENIAECARETGVVFDGCYSYHEATQPMTGKAQKLLGLPGNPPEAYEIARDKYATRKALENANLNTCKACQIWTADDIPKAFEVVGFPMIIKPTVGMGSSGVYKVSTYEELETQVSRLLNDIDTNWALAQNRVGNQAPILAETFVDPVTFGDVDLVTEFDIDCTFWDGKLMYANVIDNWFPEPPYFQDRGFHAPSLTPESIQKELIDYSAAAVKAMGFERGNFHMECWYTKTGPILIECNPRVGGGSIDMTHQQIWGVSPTLNMILAFMDIPVNPPREIKPKCSYGFMLVNARESGVIGEKSYVLDAETHKMVELAAPFKKAGDEVKGLDVGVPEWLAQVDFKTSAPTDEMIREMQFIMKRIEESAASGLVAGNPIEE